MPPMNLLDIAAQQYDIGRGVILRADYWDGASPLTLTHIGNTEGAFEPNPNSEYSVLTLPENTGPAPIKAYLSGDAPTLEFGIFVNPDILALLSPTGSGSGGNKRQRKVKEHTIWIAPEQLFLVTNPDGSQTEVELDFAGGVWTKDGEAFTAEDQRLFDVSIFAWKAYFERTMPPFRHEDGGKALMQLTLHMMQDFSKPDGHQLWTLGNDLVESGIDLEGGS